MAAALTDENRLSVVRPDIAAEFDTVRNAPLTAADFSVGSTKTIWWTSDVCGHHWQATPQYRGRGFGKCSICASFATSHPRLVPEFDLTKNAPRKPEDFRRGSGRKVWWRCSEGHSYEMVVKSRTQNEQGCPFCSGHRVLVGVNDLASKRPDVAAMWHPTKNGDLLPEDVFARGQRKVWWQCSNGHEFEDDVFTRTAPKNVICLACVSLGFLYPEVAEMWLTEEYATTEQSNERLTPFDVWSGSKISAWWRAKDCGHIWKQTVYSRLNAHRSNPSRENVCPICRGVITLPGFNDLETRNPEVAAMWHPTKNGDFTPAEVSYGSSKKAWWLCPNGHSYYSMVADRNRGFGCPNCANHVSAAEGEISDLMKGHGLKVEQSVRGVIGRHELDIYIPEIDLAIEFNGIYWHSERYGKKSSYHRDKWEKCQDKGIRLIYVWEDDWIERRSAVKQILLREIGAQPKVLQHCDASLLSLEVSADDAESFFAVNHVISNLSGDRHFALNDLTGDTVAMMSVLEESSDRESRILTIARYAEVQPSYGGFETLVNCLQRATGFDALYGLADIGSGNDVWFIENGFTLSELIDPDYRYLISNTRIDRSEHSVERFASDPSLLYGEDKSLAELEDMNGLVRVWDAGRARYRRTV